MRGYLVAGVGVCDVGACLLAVRYACVVDIIVPVVPEPRGKVGCAVVGSVGGLPTIQLEMIMNRFIIYSDIGLAS